MIRSLPYLVCALLAAMAQNALAQMRQIPDNVARGWLQHVQETMISIDGKPLRMAPGGTIRNQQNLIVVPASLAGPGALAEYKLDAAGQVSRAWLLTPEEAARPVPPRQAPTP